jgi:hypothetical protein
MYFMMSETNELNELANRLDDLLEPYFGKNNTEKNA